MNAHEPSSWRRFNDVFVDESNPLALFADWINFTQSPTYTPLPRQNFFGQNATHATLGYLAEEGRLEYMSDLVSILN